MTLVVEEVGKADAAGQKEVVHELQGRSCPGAQERGQRMIQELLLHKRNDKSVEGKEGWQVRRYCGHKVRLQVSGELMPGVLRDCQGRHSIEGDCAPYPGPFKMIQWTCQRLTITLQGG